MIYTDYTYPFSANYTISQAGSFTITAVGYNSNGTRTGSYSVTFQVAALYGPSCGTDNSSLLYELSSDMITNAINYSWYYTDSSYGVTPASGTPYKAHLNAGGYFTSGNVCVNVVYTNGTYSSYSTSYCFAVAKCSGIGEDEFEVLDVDAYDMPVIIYQNPFNHSTVIDFGGETAGVQVLSSTGVLIEETTASGSCQFGENLIPGRYLVRLNFANTSRVLKLIKP